MKYCHQSMILDSEAPGAQAVLGLALVERQAFDDAHEHLQRATRQFEGDVALLAAHGYVYARWHKRACAAKIADKLESPATPRYASPYLIARIRAALGDHQEAIQALQRAAEHRSPMLGWLGADPAFDGMRREAVFAKLLADRGLAR